MGIPLPSLSSSDQLQTQSGVSSALGDTRAGSGLRGSFVNNFVGGKNNKLSASLDASDGASSVPWGQYAIAGAAVILGVVWLKKRNG